MKKIFVKCILGFAILALLAVASYYALLKFYEFKIPYGTWVNGIYVTGLSYDEAAALLLSENTYIPEVKVVDAEGKIHKLVLPEDAYTLTYRIGLEELVIKSDIFGTKQLQMKPFVHIHTEVFDKYLEAQEICKSKTLMQGEERLEIVKEEDGFHLYDSLAYVADIDKVKSVVRNAFENHIDELVLLEENCYNTPAYSEEEQKIYDEYIKLVEFTNTFMMELTIDGEIVYTVDASVLKDWILTNKDGSYKLDRNGDYQLDKAQVKAYAKQISKEVSTYFGAPWEFTTHNGDLIEVKAGNYGRALKVDPLYKALLSGFEQGADSKALLAYELAFSFYVGFGASIGDSYIEVDLEAQEIYMYLDGELVFTSDCVTGDVWRRRETPKGVFYVEYKQRNRVLKGEDYRTPVSYWMHFYNHCGFHDASWRRAFGDEIYLRDGSHGCVNMPPAKAKELYDLVYKGIPVIVY